MTAKYDRLGLNFMYPENWKLIDETDGNPHVVTLEAPDGSSTWTVHVYPVETDGDAILKETIATLEETYEDLEITPDHDAIDRFATRGVDALFYCLDFLVRAKLCLISTDSNLLLLWTQAEDRDFDKQEIIFRAISTSMLRSFEGGEPL